MNAWTNAYMIEPISLFIYPWFIVLSKDLQRMLNKDFKE